MLFILYLSSAHFKVIFLLVFFSVRLVRNFHSSAAPDVEDRLQGFGESSLPFLNKIANHRVEGCM
jgi:hypothetical protein